MVDLVDYFPSELSEMIFSYFEPHQLLLLSVVSKKWKDFVGDTERWKRFANLIIILQFQDESECVATRGGFLRQDCTQSWTGDGFTFI
jgi:hypothetical protein